MKESFHYIPSSEKQRLPRAPGVYAFTSPQEILYIGKANNVKERIKNHFQQPTFKDGLFVNETTRIGYINTDSDIDALLLESRLIKKYQPKYNVMWKDGKQYFYVGITKEKLPRVFLTHQPHDVSRSLYLVSRTKKSRKIPDTKYKIQNTNYIGPFVDGSAIKYVLRLLRRVFPYYSQATHPAKLCPWCHLNLCPGPNFNTKEYKKNLKNLAAVLQGKRLSVLKTIEKEMRNASKNEDFEYAAKLRDQLLALKNIISHSDTIKKTLQTIFKTKKEISRIEAYDISNMQGKEATGSMVTFIDGKPAKNWYRKFKISAQGGSASGGPNDFAMMEELISRRLRHPEWPYPDLMVIDGGKPQLSAALKALKIYKIQDTRYRIQVGAIAKRHNELFLPGKSHPILLETLPQSVQNLILHIRDEAHRFAITYHKKLRRVDLFGPK